MTEITKAPLPTQGSLRAIYHMTPPSGWLCDPQRPIYSNGAFQLYYLHSEQNNGPGGWDHASTVDCVSFSHHGTAIPMRPDFPVWSGSAVIDIDNTAGFGAGAVIALATQPTDGIRKYQEQYLYWSTDGGFTFTPLPEPVIINEDGRTAETPDEIDNAEWFRDPKVHWDSTRNEWVCVIGRRRFAAFYTSPNLRDWQLKRNFDYPNHDLGGIECPDLFEMTADDGTRHWVLGASMDAYGIGLPMTYAYWTGVWDGDLFTADDPTPQWLDWGWDWYAAVTWPKTDTVRYAVAWMNNWKYANRDVPTDATDGFNGQNSIVRELRLIRQPGGWYSLLSSPVGQLEQYVTNAITIPDQTVEGNFVLPWNGRAYEIELDIAWDVATNVGLSVGLSADGTRHTDIAKSGAEIYVDRALSDLNEYSLIPYTRAAAPIDESERSVHLRVFVDTQSVEVFVNVGHTILSQIVHFTEGDTGISFFTEGGPANFSDISIREFGATQHMSTDRLRYLGVWRGNYRSDYGTYHYSMLATEPDASLEFAFRGTAFKVIGLTGGTFAKFAVYIDGEFVTDVNTYDPVSAKFQVVLYENNSLTDGIHTVKLVVLPSTAIIHEVAFSAIDVRGNLLNIWDL